nr:beta-1,3-galactosyltransferase 4-like [Dermacentor andersoni]
MAAPAQPSGMILQERVANESARYGDIIQADFRDTYRNLTLKSVFLLKWAFMYCSRAQFLLKTDDDVFVNVDNLVRFLLALRNGKRRTGQAALVLSTISSRNTLRNSFSRSNKQALLGVGAFSCSDPALRLSPRLNAPPDTFRRPFVVSHMRRNTTAERGLAHKNYLPQSVFANDNLPLYGSGTAYVMSCDAVRPLFTEALVTPFLYVEDVFITGLVAQKVCAQARPRMRQSKNVSYSVAAPDAFLISGVTSAPVCKPTSLFYVYVTLF